MFFSFKSSLVNAERRKFDELRLENTKLTEKLFVSEMLRVLGDEFSSGAILDENGSYGFSGRSPEVRKTNSISLMSTDITQIRELVDRLNKRKDFKNWVSDGDRAGEKREVKFAVNGLAGSPYLEMTFTCHAK
jgi:hypothetical protein